MHVPNTSIGRHLSQLVPPTLVIVKILKWTHHALDQYAKMYLEGKQIDEAERVRGSYKKAILASCIYCSLSTKIRLYIAVENILSSTKFKKNKCHVWDAEGPFKPLHVMNPTRLAFIRSTLCRHFRKDPHCARPFEGLKIVDVGCGGGILSEPLARMGATVTGIDAVEKNIKIARVHAELDPLTSTIEYCCTTAEKLVEEERQFDAVIALEVIEHVADPSEFCKSLAALTISNGATVISTINRSMRAYATAIIAAEYLLHWLPKGTHQWSSFLTPEELVLILQRASINVQEMAGFVYNPLTGRWALSDDISPYDG
ncbi:hypothetical protein L1049_024103 [Liquidambar formosana]|uniref:Ubiquinone biosynthesis O-methyltransferase, mitochondrial n=1 Tax=Liquidambar formosana TaxID=63359 RepID=A0AAP0RUR5_LIQFO